MTKIRTSSPELSKSSNHPIASWIRGGVLVTLGFAAGCHGGVEFRPGVNQEKNKAGEIIDKNCFEGCPEGASSSNIEIKGQILTLSNNGNTKFADWVAYCLTKETIKNSGLKKQKGRGKKGKTEREWMADPQLPENHTLEPEDYKGAPKKLKIDRGHQAPIGSFQGTPFAQTTNYLSNITPQKANLNQGPWNDLEKKERDLTKIYDRVCVVTGTLYEREMFKLPNADESHEVPSGYWKVVIVKDTRVKAFAVIMDQEKKKVSKYCADQVSIDEVESRSKLDLFPKLKDEIEDKLEALEFGELSKELGCRDSSGTKKQGKSKKGRR